MHAALDKISRHNTALRTTLDAERAASAEARQFMADGIALAASLPDITTVTQADPYATPIAAVATSKP